MKNLSYFQKQTYLLGLLFFSVIIMQACQTNKDKPAQKDLSVDSSVVHPDWAKNAVIYEVNVRQFSSEGTFQGLENDLDRLKDLGVDILWLMPIHPIGEKNRKGELGSYYSVKDYYDVNPEFGTMDDFKSLVNAIHEKGMKIIIDWVPNHTAWDNQLAKDHPDYYEKNEEGEFISPFDWTDVIQLDYDNPELRAYMLKALEFWISEIDLDGYRFDVAHMIPVDFFDPMRDSLMELKEVFLLAEADQPFLHKNAMNMSYDWRLHHIMNEVAKGAKNVMDIKNHFAYVDTAYPSNAILMQFTSNHDENSWNGTAYERLGDAVKTFATFSFVIPGMPLIYNGQEACMDKRLEFFVKDPIDWKECDLTDLYRSLIQLKKSNSALDAGDVSRNYQILQTEHPEKVFAIERIKNDDVVIGIFNFSPEENDITVPEALKTGEFKDYFTGAGFEYEENSKMVLKPWDYKVLVK
jgi:glycosidase